MFHTSSISLLSDHLSPHYDHVLSHYDHLTLHPDHSIDAYIAGSSPFLPLCVQPFNLEM